MTKLVALVSAIVLAGCLVETRPHRTVVREHRGCPPAYHWDDGACVHNGHGHGHGHGHDRVIVRDHR